MLGSPDEFSKEDLLFHRFPDNIKNNPSADIIGKKAKSSRYNCNNKRIFPGIFQFKMTEPGKIIFPVIHIIEKNCRTRPGNDSPDAA